MAAPIRDGSAVHSRKQLLYIFVIQAQNRRAVKGNFLDKFEERGANLDDGRVVVQVFAIDIGYDRENRAQLQKRAIAFVRFHHQEIAASHPSVRATHGGDFSPYDYRGIQSGHIQNSGGHGSGGGFSVTAGDGDAVFQTHQLSQHFAAGDDGDGQAARFLHFRILVVHSRADDDGLRARDVGHGMAFKNLGAELGQTVGSGAEFHVG